jgi:ferric-chelate reductase
MMWKAGQNAYITMLAISQVPFEAHPFTIASIPRDSHKVPKGMEDQQALAGVEGNELVFYIKVKEGFMKRLQDASEHQMGTRTS